MPKKRERRFDLDGPLTKLVAAEGYVMVRRPYAMPFIITQQDWNRLPPEPIPPEGKLPPIETHGGMVYFIDGGDCIKIGYTNSPEARSIKMATDNPTELKLLHAEPGTFKTEKIYHRQFAAIRVRGEWFRKTPELLEFIEQKKRIAGERH